MTRISFSVQSFRGFWPSENGCRIPVHRTGTETAAVHLLFPTASRTLFDLCYVYICRVCKWSNGPETPPSRIIWSVLSRWSIARSLVLVQSPRRRAKANQPHRLEGLIDKRLDEAANRALDCQDHHFIKTVAETRFKGWESRKKKKEKWKTL